MDLKIGGPMDRDLHFSASRFSSKENPRPVSRSAEASILTHSPQVVLGSNPVVAETCDPALALGCEARHRSEAESRRKTVANNKSVPSIESITADDRKTATEAVKKAEATEDTIFTGVKRGNFALFHIRARSKELVPVPGSKDGSKMRKVVKEQLVWLPGVVSGTLDDFVAYFASKYADGDVGAGTTRFKDRAFNAELVALRAKMKSTPAGGGKRRGKGHI